MTKRLTRSEFYNLIWSRPITKIAADFGLSDVAIHKLCRKHSIPKPVQGHWAKLAHGKPVQVIPLPRQSGAGDIVIVHEGSGRAESVAMSDARTHAKQQLEVGAEAPEPAKNQFLEKTIEALAKAKPDRAGLILLQGEKLVRVHVRPESRERTELVLRELYRHAASAGIALESRETGLAWTTDGETVSFEIVELVDKVEHVATDAELKAVAKWEAEQEARFKRYGYRSTYGKPPIAKWDDIRRGRIGIRLEEVRIRSENQYWGPVIHRTFNDTRTRDVLRTLPRVIETIAAIGVAKRENREADERRRIAAEEAARRRAEAERRAAIEKQQNDFVSALKVERAEIDHLQWLIGTLEASAVEQESRTARLLFWARERLKRHKENLAQPGLEARLATAGLFAAD